MTPRYETDQLDPGPEGTHFCLHNCSRYLCRTLDEWFPGAFTEAELRDPGWFDAEAYDRKVRKIALIATKAQRREFRKGNKGAWFRRAANARGRFYRGYDKVIPPWPHEIKAWAADPTAHPEIGEQIKLWILDSSTFFAVWGGYQPRHPDTKKFISTTWANYYYNDQVREFRYEHGLPIRA